MNALDPSDETSTGRIALELVPGMRQEQVLAPQLRASLRVLQMDLPTLASEVRHEAEVNPVVEVEDPDVMSTVSEEIRAQDQADDEVPGPSSEDDMRLFLSVDEAAIERRQRFFDRQVASESLQEHLLAQIGPAGFSEGDRQVAELIVGDIDDEGRYEGSLDELSSVLGTPVDDLEEVLRRVQTFDPPGVGGRNLRECLLIQARQLEAEPSVRELLLKIIDGRLGLVARHDTSALAEALGVLPDTCQKAISVLRTLEPKPGRPFLASGRHPQFIRPELDVEMTANGVVLSSCEHELPTLTINPLYREMADDAGTSGEIRRYLHERIGSAELLQEAIRRRGETVLRVAEVVFAEQYDFFSRGFEALRPLTIEEVARRTGFHGTTVGRAVRGKYVRTPRGVFELSRFFCVGRIGTSGAGVMSAVAVKCRLAALVREEESVARTDEDLAKELSKAGMRISRRTVAKYRSELGIPSAGERNKRRELV